MTNTRIITIISVIAFLAVLAGCIGPFASSDIPADELDKEANYTWDSDADVTIDIEGSVYRAVYSLDGETTFELSTRSRRGSSPVDIEAVRYRFPNGTMLTGSQLDISQSSSRTTIEVPDGNGTLAFTAETSSNRAVIHGLAAGSYRVDLPEGHRVGNFFLSAVSPSGYESELEGDTQVLYWDENDDDIYLDYYLSRDHYLFYGFLLSSGLVMAGGFVYYRRKINALARKRRRLSQRIETDE